MFRFQNKNFHGCTTRLRTSYIELRIWTYGTGKNVSTETSSFNGKGPTLFDACFDSSFKLGIKRAYRDSARLLGESCWQKNEWSLEGLPLFIWGDLNPLPSPLWIFGQPIFLKTNIGWLNLNISVQKELWKVKPPHNAHKKSQNFWIYYGVFQPNRVEIDVREYLNYSSITWKRSLILKTHCVLKIFLMAITKSSRARFFDVFQWETSSFWC